MLPLSKEPVQKVFIFSFNGNIKRFFSNGIEIILQVYNPNLGDIVQKAMILNFVNFRLFISQIHDFELQFLRLKDIKIVDLILSVS